MELPGAGTLLLLFCVTCLVSLFAWRNVKSRLNMPPGPTPLPLLGNLLQLDTKNIVKTLLRLSSQYGPVCTVYMGPNPVVVLNGYDAVREALLDNGEVFSSRGRIPIIEQAFKGYGVLFSNGERWKQLRRFSLSTLRNFGMGKRSIEERVQEEAKCLEDEFRKRKETPFDPTYLLSLAVSNVICSIVFGDRYDYEDEKFLSMLTLMRETFKILTSPWTQIFNIFPGILKHMPGPHNQVFRNFCRLKAYVMEKVKEHENTLDENFPRDYIDCFLLKMQQ
ncbi:hypothetical protein FKM82_025633, partial [Ascaphus truei]